MIKFSKGEALSCGFTHEGYAYGIISVWSKDIKNTQDMMGKNCLHESLLQLFIWFDVKFQLSNDFTSSLTTIQKD